MEDAKENAKMNNIRSVGFIEGNVFKLLEAAIFNNINYLIDETRINKIDVIVVDPPRDGLGEKLVSLLSKLNAKKVIYVSCNAATLARDIKVFDILGYGAKAIHPIDMFPHSVHVETCSLLARR